MIHKNELIAINENNIFLNDTLSRENTIKDLSKIIRSNTEPFVFSINASWGSGKTTFIKMWQMYLKKKHDVNSIYFSAWEDDFSKEPLISILGELSIYIKNTFPANSPQRSKFKEIVKNTSKVVTKVSPAVVKGMAGGILDLEAGYETAIAALSEGTAKALIEKYSDNKNVLKEFKQSIENVLKEIDKDKPFIIFIDELDRCKPLYSIELLERIKHVFGIKNLTFVLSIDKSQLTESIKSQYGNIDANKYLKRFIDLEYNLNNINIDAFCDNLYKKFDLQNILDSKGIKKEAITFHHLTILKKLAHLFNLSLRDIEQVFTKLNLLFSTIEPHLFDSHFRVFVFFEMIKSYDSNLYFNLIKGKDIKKVKELVLPKFLDENIYRNTSIIFETIIDSIGKSEEEYYQLILIKQKELDSMADNKNLEYKRLEHYLNILSNGFDDWDDYKLNKLVDTVIKKIEFTEQFNFETVS